MPKFKNFGRGSLNIYLTGKIFFDIRIVLKGIHEKIGEKKERIERSSLNIYEIYEKGAK